MDFEMRKEAGLNSWAISANPEKKFFGLTRNHFVHEEITYWADIHVSDWEWIERSWKERLFSWPWRPWISHKTISCCTMFFIDDGKTGICSFGTLAKLIKELKIEDEPSNNPPI